MRTGRAGYDISSRTPRRTDQGLGCATVVLGGSQYGSPGNSGNGEIARPGPAAILAGQRHQTLEAGFVLQATPPPRVHLGEASPVLQVIGAPPCFGGIGAYGRRGHDPELTARREEMLRETARLLGAPPVRVLERAKVVRGHIQPPEYRRR